MSNAALDKKILLPPIAIVLLTSAPLIFYASSLQGMIQSIYDFTAKSFGWGYILLYLRLSHRLSHFFCSGSGGDCGGF